MDSEAYLAMSRSADSLRAQSGIVYEAAYMERYLEQWLLMHVTAILN